MATASDGYRIRLRGPWRFRWLADRPELPVERREGRLFLPTTWTQAFGPLTGSVRLSRSFGNPPGYQGRVLLGIATVHGAHAVELNGERLGAASAGLARFDVTDRLDTRNRLEIDLTWHDSAQPDHPLIEVALMFEPAN